MIDFFLVRLLVWMFGIGQLLRYAYKRIVDIRNVYIEKNNLQVELMRCRNKYLLYSRLILRSDGFNAHRSGTEMLEQFSVR